MNDFSISLNEKPSIETIREVRINYTESSSYKSVCIETLATMKELRKIIYELLGGE